jgi:hypothetical protein
MSDSLRKIKTITSHAGHARFLAETDKGIVGEVARSVVPAEPYRFSLTKQVLSWRGRSVVVLETSHRRFEVFEVPSAAIMAVTPFSVEG